MGKGSLLSSTSQGDDKIYVDEDVTNSDGEVMVAKGESVTTFTGTGTAGGFYNLSWNEENDPNCVNIDSSSTAATGCANSTETEGSTMVTINDPGKTSYKKCDQLEIGTGDYDGTGGANWPDEPVTVVPVAPGTVGWLSSASGFSCPLPASECE